MEESGIRSTKWRRVFRNKFQDGTEEDVYFINDETGETSWEIPEGYEHRHVTRKSLGRQASFDKTASVGLEFERLNIFDTTVSDEIRSVQAGETCASGLQRLDNFLVILQSVGTNEEWTVILESRYFAVLPRLFQFLTGSPRLVFVTTIFRILLLITRADPIIWTRYFSSNPSKCYHDVSLLLQVMCNILINVDEYKKRTLNLLTCLEASMDEIGGVTEEKLICLMTISEIMRQPLPFPADIRDNPAAILAEKRVLNSFKSSIRQILEYLTTANGELFKQLVHTIISVGSQFCHHEHVFETSNSTCTYRHGLGHSSSMNEFLKFIPVDQAVSNQLDRSSAQSSVIIFIEGLLQIFNEHLSPLHTTIPARQCRCILFAVLSSADSCAHLIYSNDRAVLVDMILRDVTCLSIKDLIRIEYLELLRLIILNSAWFHDGRYKRDEILTMLSGFLDNDCANRYASLSGGNSNADDASEYQLPAIVKDKIESIFVECASLLE